MTDAGPPAASPPVPEPSGWAPPAAPARPRARLRWLAVAIPMVVLIVAGGILAVVLGVGKLTEPIDVTNDYLSALSDGRYEDAYALLCDSRRDSQSEADFVSTVQRERRTQGPITGYDFKSSEITNSTARTEGTIEIDGVEYDAHARLHHDDGDWRICSVSLDG